MTVPEFISRKEEGVGITRDRRLINITRRGEDISDWLTSPTHTVIFIVIINLPPPLVQAVAHGGEQLPLVLDGDVWTSVGRAAVLHTLIFGASKVPNCVVLVGQLLVAYHGLGLVTVPAAQAWMLRVRKMCTGGQVCYRRKT